MRTYDKQERAKVRSSELDWLRLTGRVGPVSIAAAVLVDTTGALNLTAPLLWTTDPARYCDNLCDCV